MFDATANGERVGGIRAGVDDCGEAVAQKHVGQLRVEQVVRFPLGQAPLGLSEMDVRVPEAGSNDAMIARHDGSVCGDFDLLPYGGDEAVADEDRAVLYGWFRG